jgi:hypothetical protein
MKDLSTLPRLACRVLHPLAIMLVSCSGCVLPTQLSQEPQEANFPPVLTRAIPAFGPLGPFNTQNDFYELHLFAVDANASDTVLHARLFFQRPMETTRHFAQQEATLTLPPAGVQAADIPNTERTGSFFQLVNGAHLCGEVLPTGGDLFALVADRPFSITPGMEDLAPGGKVTENHWDLACVQ